MSHFTKGYVSALVGITFWSTTGVFIGVLIQQHAMPALLLAFWRNLLVCVVLVPSLFLIRRSLLHISIAQISFLLSYGLILALFNSVWVLAVETNGAAVATVLGYSSAGFTAVLACWLFREKLGLSKTVAVALSLSGCVMVSGAYDLARWNLNPLGAATGLLSGLMFAGYSLMGKEAARREINPWTSMLYSFAFGSLFIMLFNLFPKLPGAAGTLSALLPSLAPEGWLTLVALSFGPTVLGFGLYNISLNYLPASIVNLLATLEPVMTAMEAYVFLDERMTATQLIGGAVILSAAVVVQFERD